MLLLNDDISTRTISMAQGLKVKFGRFHQRRHDGRLLFRTALVSAVLALGLPASALAGAAVTTTIQFGSPATPSPTAAKFAVSDL
jgi:hypothetical protein